MTGLFSRLPLRALGFALYALAEAIPNVEIANILKVLGGVFFGSGTVAADARTLKEAKKNEK